MKSEEFPFFTLFLFFTPHSSFFTFNENFFPIFAYNNVNMSHRIGGNCMKIKYLIYSLIALFLVCLPMQQEAFGRPKPKSKNSCTISRSKFTQSDLIEYRYGLKIGENIATIKSQKGASQDVLTGLTGGAVLQIVWPKGFAIQPEMLYSRKGCIFSGSGVRYDIDYLEVPVGFMYRLHFAEVKPFAFVAPYGAYAFRFVENGDNVADDTYSSQIGKWDYGIGAGAGFDVWKIQLSFKYSWGFAKVIEEDFVVRNKVFTVAAAFLF